MAGLMQLFYINVKIIILTNYAIYWSFAAISLKIINELQDRPRLQSLQIAQKMYLTYHKAITDMVPHNHIAPGPIYNVFGMGQRSMSLSHSIGKSKRTEINHRL